MTKFRNRMLALLCLVVFAGLGLLYFRVWVVPRTFGIVLFVSEALSPEQLVAARLYHGGSQHRLEAERFPNLAMVRNYSADHAVPDTAAAASALATGVRVKNFSCAVAPGGRNLESLLRRARRAGRSTGIVTTERITGGGVAPFYASTERITDYEDISAQLVEGGIVDVVLGGGRADLQPETKGGKRRDGRDLLLELSRKGYYLARTRDDLAAAPSWPKARVAGLFASGTMASADEIGQSAVQPRLDEMVRRAIELLQSDRDGYFLVVYAGGVARAARANRAETAILESIEANVALRAVREYGGENTTIIATALHGVGGMTVNGYPMAWQSGLDLLGINHYGVPSITWSTGPNAPLPANHTPDDPTADNPNPPPDLSRLAPAAAPVPEALNTAGDIIAVGSGPGTSQLRGFVRATDLHEILRDQL